MVVFFLGLISIITIPWFLIIYLYGFGHEWTKVKFVVAMSCGRVEVKALTKETTSVGNSDECI